MKQIITLIALSFLIFSCNPPFEDYYCDAIGMNSPDLIKNVDDLEYSVKNGWVFGALTADSICFVTKYPLSDHESGHVDFVLGYFKDNFVFLDLLPAIRDFEKRNGLFIDSITQRSDNTYYIRTSTKESLLGPDTVVQFVSIFRGLE